MKYLPFLCLKMWSCLFLPFFLWRCLQQGMWSDCRQPQELHQAISIHRSGREPQQSGLWRWVQQSVSLEKKGNTTSKTPTLKFHSKHPWKVIIEIEGKEGKPANQHPIFMGLLLLLNFRSATRPFEVISTSGARRSLGNGGPGDWEWSVWITKVVAQLTYFFGFFLPRKLGKDSKPFWLELPPTISTQSKLGFVFQIIVCFLPWRISPFSSFSKMPIFQFFTARGIEQ